MHCITLLISDQANNIVLFNFHTKAHTALWSTIGSPVLMLQQRVFTRVETISQSTK